MNPMAPLVANPSGPPRPVSGLERVWLAADRVEPPFAITAEVRWPVDVAPERVSSALRVAFEAWPGFRVLLRGRLGGSRWVPSLEEVPVVDAGQPLPMLDVGRGPVCGVRRVERGFDLWVHHAVADGRAVLGLLEAFSLALAGERPAPAEAGPRFDRDLPVPPSLVEARAPIEDQPSPLGGADTGAKGSLTLRRRLTGSLRGLLPRMLAGLADQAAVAGLASARVAVPVDLRRYAPDWRSSANLTGITHLDLEPALTVEAVRARLQAAQDRHEALAQARAAAPLRGVPIALMGWIGRRGASRCRAAGRFAVAGTVSNLGAYDLRIDGQPMEVRLVPPGVATTPVFAVVVGDALGACLAVRVPTGLGDGGRAERFVDAWLSRVAASG